MSSNDILLKELLDDVHAGEIQLPDFQRGWVWDDTRIKELLISISRGFPIGAVMTLDATGDVRFASKLIKGVYPPNRNRNLNATCSTASND